MSPKDIGRLGV